MWFFTLFGKVLDSHPSPTMAQHLRGRNLASMPEVGREELGWMAMGFALAVICLGLGYTLWRLLQFFCRRSYIPNKINTTTGPDLPAGETRSESEEASTSRLAAFFQNTRPALDATSEISQSDVWSYSLKSFTHEMNTHLPQDYEDDEGGDDSSGDLDDATFDASLYTSVTMEPTPVAAPANNTPVETAKLPRSSRRRGAPVEI